MTEHELEMSFLIVGDSGTEKTRFLGGCPDPIIFDIDKGTASLSDTKGWTAVTIKDAPYKSKPMPSRGIYDYGTGWLKFVEKVNEVGSMIDKGTCPYKTIGLDSITTLSSLAMNYVLKSDSKSGSPPFIQHWGAQMALLETVMDQLTAWPLIKIVTAHIQRNTNGLTEVTEILPLVTGKLAGKLSVYFDEVYYTNVKFEGADKTRKVSFITQSTPVIKQAKSRHGVPDGIPATWAEVAKALGKRARAAA